MVTEAQPDPSDPIGELIEKFEGQYLKTISCRDANAWVLEGDRLMQLEQEMVSVRGDDLREVVRRLIGFLHDLPHEWPL